MLFFIVSTISFFLILSKSLRLHPLPSWATEIRLLSFLFMKELLLFPAVSLRNCTSNSSRALVMKASKKKCSSRVENVEDSAEMSFLDLPELALESILGRLSTDGLCNMASVCRPLRDLCWSDYLWERHMREKWGKVIGASAQTEWKKCLTSRKELSPADVKPRRLLGPLSRLWPFSWLGLIGLDGSSKLASSLPHDSIISWYSSLESGKFWFPAQVYNREHGHVGFMLSCYDAELSYDCKSDTFHARYPPHGRRNIVIEEAVQWDRIRAPPVETPSHDLHVSDCLCDLRPGDHIEIQWRRNKVFPYGWWYGTVGHLESCDKYEHFCHCRNSETIVLEFNQYTPGSRWRRAVINRKNHREEGNATDGFYGGIRKLHAEDEISTWRRFWPQDIVE